MKKEGKERKPESTWTALLGSGPIRKARNCNAASPKAAATATCYG